MISENMSGELAVKCSLLTGIYGVGSWEGRVEQEWDDTKLGHREDLKWERALEIVQEVFVTASVKGDCTKISEVLGKEGEDMGMKEAGVFTGGAHQDSISKHHVAWPAIDAGEMTTGQGTAF